MGLFVGRALGNRTTGYSIVGGVSDIARAGKDLLSREKEPGKERIFHDMTTYVQDLSAGRTKQHRRHTSNQQVACTKQNSTDTDIVQGLFLFFWRIINLERSKK